MQEEPSTLFIIILLLWLISPIILAIMWWLSAKKVSGAQTRADEAEISADTRIASAQEELQSIQKQYSPIIDQEKEIQRLILEKNQISKDLDSIKAVYAEKRPILNKLRKKIAIYDEQLSFIEMGVYEPHFDFDDSEAYKLAIKEVRGHQKLMVSEKAATQCPTDWTVNGSEAQGRTMVNRQSRLSLRAFNNECEAAIANTRWNNINAMEKRIISSASAINKANDSMKVKISEAYVKLKLKEIYLTHEYREKRKVEKEERAEVARAEREEKRLLAEAKQAEKEEQKWQALLEKARIQAGGAQQTSAMKKKIAELEEALAEAHDRKERAQSMAELTKSGYIYIISNAGSFGEDVVKIGLTRRLNPDDRVKELGDASVPFGFDTHAIIYSDEAPTLEAALHKEFDENRVNLSNMRKEFFRVSLSEVEQAVDRLAPTASFFKDREAQEWHETLSRRQQLLEKKKQFEEDGDVNFPDVL